MTKILKFAIGVGMWIINRLDNNHCEKPDYKVTYPPLHTTVIELDSMDAHIHKMNALYADFIVDPLGLVWTFQILDPCKSSGTQFVWLEGYDRRNWNEQSFGQII